MFFNTFMAFNEALIAYNEAFTAYTGAFTAFTKVETVKPAHVPADVIYITEARRLRFKAKLIRRARRGR